MKIKRVVSNMETTGFYPKLFILYLLSIMLVALTRGNIVVSILLIFIWIVGLVRGQTKITFK